ncbi:MAG TPA: helicase-related protein [Planctomycetota bacterium]|nr:helicase-related protein [Planctomycetota bacterium]
MESCGTTLDLCAGVLRVCHWPSALRPPFGLVPAGAELRGPARLRAAVRRTLQQSGAAFDDRVTPPPLAPETVPRPPQPAPTVLHAWLANDRRGIACGLPETTRLDLVMAAVHTTRQQALVVVRDSGAESMWLRVFGSHGVRRGGEEVCAVATAADAARTMHWRARRHDLLVVDRPEQMPHTTLEAVLDGSAASSRLGFVDRPDARLLLRWAAGLGPVVGVAHAGPGPHRLELVLPLPAHDRITYDAAWHTFLGAFDAFAATRPQAGFGTFVQQARRDERQRPALLAWHRALHVASWNEAKAAATAELLQRHRQQRVLVFTPSRESAYQLACTHLIAPVTAELPRRERQQALAAFCAGRLRALVGPRLLDLGVPEGTADVGVLVGGGYGRNQHDARCRRVGRSGLVYQLVALDTVEVGRAHRFGRSAAGATAVADPGRR